MKISEKGLKFIARREGFRPHVYKDVAGHATIGYGHLVKDGEDWAGGITRPAARALLDVDADIAEKAVNGLVSAFPLSQPQFDALVSFTFNVGTGGFRSSTLRRLLKAGNCCAVPYELSRWNKAGGTPVRGLTRRRKAEGVMWRGV